jgi:hypothetical protein
MPKASAGIPTPRTTAASSGWPCCSTNSGAPEANARASQLASSNAVDKLR